MQGKQRVGRGEPLRPTPPTSDLSGVLERQQLVHGGLLQCRPRLIIIGGYD